MIRSALVALALALLVPSSAHAEGDEERLSSALVVGVRAHRGEAAWVEDPGGPRPRLVGWGPGGTRTLAAGDGAFDLGPDGRGETLAAFRVCRALGDCLLAARRTAGGRVRRLLATAPPWFAVWRGSLAMRRAGAWCSTSRAAARAAW